MRRLRRLGRRVVGRVLVQPLRRAGTCARRCYRSLVQEPQIVRLLSSALTGERHALVVGSARAVRQCLPGAVLDVVGTDPLDPTVSVVSTADGEGSLPRRWKWVIVTDLDVTVSRLKAAVGACLPDGTVTLVTRRRTVVRLGEDLGVHRVARSRTLALHSARVAP